MLKLRLGVLQVMLGEPLELTKVKVGIGGAGITLTVSVTKQPSGSLAVICTIRFGGPDGTE